MIENDVLNTRINSILYSFTFLLFLTLSFPPLSRCSLLILPVSSPCGLISWSHDSHCGSGGGRRSRHQPPDHRDWRHTSHSLCMSISITPQWMYPTKQTACVCVCEPVIEMKPNCKVKFPTSSEILSTDMLSTIAMYFTQHTYTSTVRYLLSSVYHFQTSSQNPSMQGKLQSFTLCCG